MEFFCSSSGFVNFIFVYGSLRLFVLNVPSCFTEKASGVALIHKYQRIVFVRQVAYVGKWSNITCASGVKCHEKGFHSLVIQQVKVEEHIN